jgi:hypothetical protein
VIEISDILLNEERPNEKPLTPPLLHEPSLQKTNLSKNSNSMPSNNDNRMPTSSSRRNKQQVMKLKVDHLNQDGVKNFDEPYFHQNDKDPAFVAVASSTKISFNIIVSGFRTLPSSIGPLKLEITVIDSSGNQIISKEEVLSDLTGDMYNPNVNFIKKINDEVPPSAVLLIRITALNVLSYDPSLLGFAYFHLFYN